MNKEFKHSNEIPLYDLNSLFFSKTTSCKYKKKFNDTRNLGYKLIIIIDVNWVS